ncbi:MAG TPA: ATP-grasp domain-containing protein [Acidimicrobiales bacterium]|nr:ATP-grasp domain-containing protein [Acidimicrobiales bacterium]
MARLLRLLLLLPSSTYRAADFLEAARRLRVELVVASERPQALRGVMGDRAVVLDPNRPEEAVQAAVALAARRHVDAVVAVDDQGVELAARVAEALGVAHNPVAAVAATRHKGVMRQALERAGVPQPEWRLVDPAEGAAGVARAVTSLGPPCVVKPVSLAASRGVIRVDDAAGASAVADRVRGIARAAGHPDEPLLVESYVPGPELAVEALLLQGELRVLAVFDKPDPLEGPYFEETIFVTPSRLPAPTGAAVTARVADAAAALGLSGGPVHAELRVPGGRPVVVELAARSIGGLCSRALRFGLGMSLEEVILRHALAMPLAGLVRESAASGVMMLPIPAAGTLVAVRGQAAARAVPGIRGLEITIPRGRTVVPLPEGDRYLGFLFARGASPHDVEAALREAHACLRLDIRRAA